MKVIISHDVDHLYNTDHFMDLYFIKLWLRSSIEFFKNKITAEEFALRMVIPFQRKMHRLEELMQFDLEHGIPSTFFFGMSCGLGMSYTQKKAVPEIHKVHKQGFIVGVHGVAFSDYDEIKKEHDDFATLIKLKDFGMRTHYVRYNDFTFKKLSEIGYMFDSSEFNKLKGYTLKSPYKIDDMWEFPLNLMDSYLPYNFEKAKEKTLEILKEAQQKNQMYFTILFHDKHYMKAYGQYQKWYQWLIEYLNKNDHEFINFVEAIKLLELN